MSKKKTIKVQDLDISIESLNDQDYISLTDMVKAKDGDFFISDWLRNKNTLEYLSTWEQLNNESFNYGEFAIINKKSGLNNFKVSVKDWVKKTNAIGIYAKTGRYGGTYAHKDIAFNFGMWISPAFQLYLVKEFQRLKELENDTFNIEWNVKRVLSKVNYTLQTDAVRDYILPKMNINESKKWIQYAKEADILNVAVFGCTAKAWKDANPKLKNSNIRDYATIIELTVLSNLESINAIMIKQGMDRRSRLSKLIELASQQKESLKAKDFIDVLNKTSSKGIVKKKEPIGGMTKFNQDLKKALDFDFNKKIGDKKEE